MAEVEIKRKIRLTRKQAGERLIALGKALTQAPRSEVDFDGESISFEVADHVDWEFELEVDGGELELEIELKWSNSAATEPAPAPAAARAPARRRTKTARSSDSS